MAYTASNHWPVIMYVCNQLSHEQHSHDQWLHEFGTEVISILQMPPCMCYFDAQCLLPSTATFHILYIEANVLCLLKMNKLVQKIIVMSKHDCGACFTWFAVSFEILIVFLTLNHLHCCAWWNLQGTSERILKCISRSKYENMQYTIT